MMKISLESAPLATHGMSDGPVGVRIPLPSEVEIEAIPAIEAFRLDSGRQLLLVGRRLLVHIPSYSGWDSTGLRGVNAATCQSVDQQRLGAW